MIVSQFASMSLTNVVIVCGIIAFVIKTLAEERGWLRSTRILRRENEDLVRRNGDLDSTVERLRGRLDVQDRDLKDLRAQVTDLRSRDQASVIAALARAESSAVGRYDALIVHQEAATAVLVEIRDLIRNGRS